MALFDHLLVILLLVAISGFFSMSEIALAAARKVKLQILETDGDPRASKVLALQQEPGHFFTVVQIALNAIAIIISMVSSCKRKGPRCDCQPSRDYFSPLA